MPQLTWLGDAEAKRAARRVPYRLLDPVEQVGDPAAQNMLIQGDNLNALKALMPFARAPSERRARRPRDRLGDRAGVLVRRRLVARLDHHAQHRLGARRA